MAEHGSELGTNLPRIHQELIYAARRETRDPDFSERLAKSLAESNTHLWDEINLEATKLAGDNLDQRREIMQFGMRIVDYVDRAITTEEMAGHFAMEPPAEPTDEVATTAPNKHRLRHWFAGQAALLGFGVSAFRKRPKDDDGVLE